MAFFLAARSKYAVAETVGEKLRRINGGGIRDGGCFNGGLQRGSAFKLVQKGKVLGRERHGLHNALLAPDQD